MSEELFEKIKTKDVKTGVIGLGYVGLPLAVKLAEADLNVLGIDVDEDKVKQLNQGNSYVLDVPDNELQKVVDSGDFSATTDYSRLAECDAISICVPTPLRKTKDPDTSYIISVVDELVKYMTKDTLVILESTTYPGTTEELIQSRLEEELDFTVGEDFYLCFSPERVDPGNEEYDTQNTPKVIGGTTEKGLKLAKELYGAFSEEIVPVSSTKVAETVKLLENTFRSVNIGLVNEMAMMCERMGIDVWEVIEAAATKPFGFMPFYPGPGIGGHCIPLDPMYLSWKAKTYDFYNEFIDLASNVNGNMPRFTVRKIADILNEVEKPIKGSKILILGMAYKADVDDLRESPGLELYRLLENKGAEVDYYDPHAESFDNAGEIVYSIELTADKLKSYDCAVLATAHSAFDYEWIAEHADVILDTRNAFNGIENKNIYKLGAPLDSSEKVSPLFREEEL